MNLGFYATVAVLVAGAALTIALVFRLLMRWTTPEADRPPLNRHATTVAVLAVVAFIGVQGGTAIADAMREPSAWEEQIRQASEQRRQDEDAVCGLVAVGDFAGAHQAAAGSDQNMMDLVQPLSDLAAYRSGDDLRLVMNAAEHVTVRCQNGTWRQTAALIDPPIPQTDLDEAAASVATVLADVCAAAETAQFGVAQRILNEAVVLPGLTETLGALHDRIARSGESQIIERWIDGIRDDWCPNLPATDDLLAMWAGSHRSIQIRFIIASTRDGDPCIETRERGIAASQLSMLGPDSVVGVGRLGRGDGVGPLNEVRCWVSTDSPIPVEISDTYRLVAGETELASLTDAEVVASGGAFEIEVALDPASHTDPILVQPGSIGGVAVASSSTPLADLEALLGTDHISVRADEDASLRIIHWPDHSLSVAVGEQTMGVVTFDGWEYRGDSTVEFVTDEGITVGSSVARLEAAYGNRLLWSQPRPACGEGWIFVVGDDYARLEGLLDGPPDQASTVVRLWSGEELRCRGALPRAVAASTTTTTHEPATTTVAASTTTTTTLTPTVTPHSLVLPDGVELLSAHSDGIDLLSGSSSVPVLTGVDVSLAWPDYLGGVVLQRVADRPDWEFDHDLDRWMPIWTDSAEVSGVEWIPQVGGPAEMLVSGDELSTVSPYRADTTLIEGAATLVYHRVIGVEHPCDDVMSEDECMWRTAHGFANHVTALDLETGQERPLGITDVFETYSDVSIGGSVAAVTGAEPTSLAMVDVADLAALGTTGHVLETVSSAWMVYTPEVRCEHQPPEAYGRPGLDSGRLVSPDGTTLALVESHPPCSEGEDPTAYIVVLEDVGSRTDDPVFQLNTRLLDPYAHVVDYDGEYLLIETGGQNIVVDRQGTVTPLPDCECRYRFWSEPS